MAIYKTQYGTYRVRVTVGYDEITGKPIRKGSTHKLRREAVAEERKILASVKEANSSVTFEDFCELYFLPAKEKSVRFSTYRVYRSRLRNHIYPRFGSRKINEITRLDVQSLISAQNSQANAKHIRALLGTIFNFAVDSGAITASPAKGRFTPPQAISHRRSSGVVLSDFSQHKEFYELVADKHPLNIATYLGLGFGLRKGEILALTKKDIDFKNKTIKIDKTYAKSFESSRYVIMSPKTANSYRTVPAFDYVLEKLRPLVEGLEDDDFVVSINGKRLSADAISSRLRHFTATHDVPSVTFQSMRHSYATAHIRAGTPVSDVSKLLGHESVATTFNAYVRPQESDVKESVKDINKRFFRTDLS